MFKSKKFILFLVLAGLLVALPALALARKSQENFYVGPEEIIEDNLVSFANITNVEGVINKDAVVAGESVNVTGEVKGNLIALGETVRVSGKVAGTLIILANNAEFNGQAAKNVFLISGNNVIIGDQADIAWDLFFLAKTAEIKGGVQGGVNGAGVNVILTNKTDGDVNLKISRGGQLTLGPAALLKGDLKYSAFKAAVIQEGSKIEGETDFQLTAYKPSKKYAWTAGKVFGMIISWFGLAIVGLVLIHFMRRPVVAVSSLIIKRPWVSLGWGLVFLIVPPVLSVLLALTVIGLPLALIILALYFIILYLSKILIGLVIGLEIIWLFDKKAKVSNLIWPLILGIAIFVILANLPFVGWIFKLAGMLWALGAIVQMARILLIEKQENKK